MAFVEGGDEVRRKLVHAQEVSFERASAVRDFPSYRGQRNYPGLYYAATMDEHVGYESWLERDEAMALDFAVDVVGFASQPFWLFWSDGQRVRSHAPDFFARLKDGTGVVIDCRPSERIRSRDAGAFEATEQACDSVGWQYRLVAAYDPTWLSNVRWLAGYRHDRFADEAVGARLCEVFADGASLMDGAAEVGDPIAVLPVLFHQMWSHRLGTDLSQRLDAGAWAWDTAS
ncbi:TnsA-like heteromeric transposase endonuclease subunit [Actinomadura harenae]|uniref:TnsA-like heteromeric transposase endonuclease subunit n=1 Tax=Actinomadura harenae TaxID=2483351 RepID=UPI0018F6C2D7|nr:TnsA-like heteromeric transposase endonuclease subunit [Actinomadura harenae]